ncbi:LCCL domain-containing protein [Rhizodiscina lignyota]|uniref:LCCL domain-containing protein n=1 Tax=Rhizodiscina lignyota TaxID=1504668 RepID=A0A9P4M645_9PEZI|nr:LCCL domain-containing protein [Rhizodiscina lignyota]
MADADESAAFLRPSDDELGESSEDDLSPEQLKHSVLRYIPPRIRKAGKAVARWTKGPNPPRIYKIKPIFPQVQEAPIKLLDRYLPKKRHKFLLLIAFYFLWLLCFSLVLHKSAFSSDVPGYGSPVRLSCGASYWANGNGCGLNGDQCRPFSNSTLTFRCPANCKRVEVINPHAVGDQEVVYKPLVVGGPTDPSDPISSSIYRGDSFICGSAIHSGFFSDTEGGCGVLRLVGEQSNYPSTKANGIGSIGFDSYFPRSFSFIASTASRCADLRWPLLGVSLTFTILLSLFTTSPGIFFWSLYVGLFFHVALVSDPPSLADYYSLVSLALGRFLPASFCAYVVYRFCVIRSLTGLTAQVEKTILWLGACWVGCLNNYTFDRIPIQRLTPSDIKAQPGAVPALISIVLIIFSIALGQAWAIRREGRMRKYLAVYGIFVAVILILVAIPRMNVRIHHYILGMLLIFGTAMQNRPSLLYQGLLFGLFINGIARWGFDSILQTPGELRGDAPLGTELPGLGIPPIIHNNFGTSMPGNVTFDFSRTVIPRDKGFDGISVLVNDVERFRAYEGGIYGSENDEGVGSFTWVRRNVSMPEYFRFGFMSGSSAGDYSKAGVWSVDGGWTHPKPGPSL